MNTSDITYLMDAFNSSDLANATNITDFGGSRITTKDPYSMLTIFGLIVTGFTATGMYKTNYCNSYVVILMQMLIANILILLGLLGASLFPVGTHTIMLRFFISYAAYARSLLPLGLFIYVIRQYVSPTLPRYNQYIFVVVIGCMGWITPLLMLCTFTGISYACETNYPNSADICASSVSNYMLVAHMTPSIISILMFIVLLVLYAINRLIAPSNKADFFFRPISDLDKMSFLLPFFTLFLLLQDSDYIGEPWGNSHGELPDYWIFPWKYSVGQIFMILLDTIMPEKQILDKRPAVIQWVSSKSGASPRRDYIPTKIRMGNGVELPFIGLGTSSVENSEEATEYSIRTALDLGYTHIDVTPGTHKTVGNVLKEYMDSGKLTRQDIFITTKLPCISHSRASVATSLNSQLKFLQLDYVDLFLVQSPCGMSVRQTTQGRKRYEPTNSSLPETWKGMEDVYKLKLTRAIGISNFNIDQITTVYCNANVVKPHNLQVEVHLHWTQKDLVVLCQSLNVSLTAYAPLGSPGLRLTDEKRDTNPLDEPLVTYLAEKYNKSPAQILLKQLTQRNIVVIPRSTNAQHLKENLDSLNFTISDNDMEALANVKSRGRIYTYLSRRDHPEYPFNENDDE